jgi:hypothetical protein
MNISALVVGLNESKYLDKCLQSIHFCDEILYYDLESNDNSIEIAKKYTDIVITHPKVPIAEFIQEKVYKKLKNNWFIIIDPDEFLDDKLISYIKKIDFDKLKKVGGIVVDWKFFFANKELKGTIWGKSKKLLIYHKERINISSEVHKGRYILDEYETFNVDNSNGSLNHQWLDNYTDFINKHLKYISLEKKINLNDSFIISTIKFIISAPYNFFNSFILKRGYRDGIIGFNLSILWAFYGFLKHLNNFKRHFNYVKN